MSGASVLAATFLAMGALAWRKHPRGRVGPLAVAVGALLLLASLALPVHPVVERLLAAGWTAVLIHLVAALPTGRMGSPLLRTVVALAYANTLLLLTPLLEGGPPDSLVVDAGLFVAIVLGALVTALQWVRWRRTSVPGRRSLTPVLAAAAVMVVLLSPATRCGRPTARCWTSAGSSWAWSRCRSPTSRTSCAPGSNAAGWPSWSSSSAARPRRPAWNRRWPRRCTTRRSPWATGWPRPASTSTRTGARWSRRTGRRGWRPGWTAAANGSRCSCTTRCCWRSRR
ncbi:hypothetical protein BJF78_27035 [Pseudonocardia sp. CNS-139]|nr:hypothetical protein BJF78_27035 [Pseudonocardia sp. CNS-139]